MEDLQKANDKLQKQVKELERELQYQKRRIKYRQYKEEFALLPQVDCIIEDWPSPEKEWPNSELKEKENRIKLLRSLDLYPYDFSWKQLMILCYDMFESLQTLSTFKIPEDEMHLFLFSLKDSYREVPFHNFFHAFNVAQTMYFFLTTCNISQKFNSLEQLALMLSSFCHDIDHPGVTNSFQINAGTKKAILYNDFSVLEMHHCHETFKLLSRLNVLSTLDQTQYKQIRKIICSCILATDLAVHGDFMTQLKNRFDKINWDSFDDKKLLMCCLVKAADISNEIRPGYIGRKWASRVMAEFFTQTAIEKMKGLPSMPHMDPTKTTISSSQIGFIGFLCLPFFELVASVLPELQICVDNLNKNKENWQVLEDLAKSKKS